MYHSQGLRCSPTDWSVNEKNRQFPDLSIVDEKKSQESTYRLERKCHHLMNT
jgi:hypothetical protein